MRQRGRPLFESAATTGGADADSDRMRTVARAHASVYMHTFFGGHVAAVRRGELKLIVHEFRDAQLFNISADPREDVDISGFADPLLLADMHEELRRYRPTSNFRGRDSAVHAHPACAAQSCVCGLVV